MGFFAHAQTVDTRPLFPPNTWPGYEANAQYTIVQAQHTNIHVQNGNMTCTHLHNTCRHNISTYDMHVQHAFILRDVQVWDLLGGGGGGGGG